MYTKLAIASLAGLVGGNAINMDEVQEVYPFTRRDGTGGSHHHAAPASSYGAPEQSYEAPAPSYSAPAPSYSAPAPSYSAPSYAPTSYEAPASSYDTPSYGAPESSYTSPSSGYGAPSYGAAEEGGLDMMSMIIPILALIGLSLLFPTSVALANVKRKRRSAHDEEEVSGNSLVERVQDIYMSVIESEECMERIACEMGGIVADAGISKDIFKAAAPLVSGKFSSAMKQFNNAKDCKKIKCGTFY